MATVKKASFGTLYKGYIARLKALGCTFCPACYAYTLHAPDSCVALSKAA
jgi:putative component of membrane protein insertase Oxa1/YidC/SpoIIIJ protein YidD